MKFILFAVSLLILTTAFIQQKKQINIEGKWKLVFNADCIGDADSIWLEKYKSSVDTVSLIEFRTNGFMEVYSKYFEESMGSAIKIYGEAYNQCSAYSHKSFYRDKHNNVFFHWVNQPLVLTKNEVDSMSKSQLVEHFNTDLGSRWFYYETKEVGDKLLLVRKHPN